MHVLASGMSDHLPKAATRTYQQPDAIRKDQRTTITYIHLKNLNEEQLIASLNEAPWDCAFVFEDSTDVADGWYKIFNSIVDSHLPLKYKKGQTDGPAKMIYK